MKVELVQCDNPKCNSLGKPEYIEEDGSHNPPYGWIFLKGGFFGSGPCIKIEVDKIQCIRGAVTRAIKEAKEAEED